MKLTFKMVQKAVLDADDAKGTGYDVKANQFSASFSQMFKFLAKKEADYQATRVKKDQPYRLYESPALTFLSDTLDKYVNAEWKERAKQARKSKRPDKKGR